MASDGRLTLDLESRVDENGKVFYISKLKGPFNIDCSEGVCFLIFTSEPGSETLQISTMTSPKKKSYDNER